jgi:hypothetical protein
VFTWIDRACLITSLLYGFGGEDILLYFIVAASFPGDGGPDTASYTSEKEKLEKELEF